LVIKIGFIKIKENFKVLNNLRVHQKLFHLNAKKQKRQLPSIEIIKTVSFPETAFCGY